MKTKILTLLGALVLLISVISCSERNEVLADNGSAPGSVTEKKPVAGNYTLESWVSDNGYTLNITVDQSKTQAVSHLLLQTVNCDGNYLDNNNVVSSSVPVDFTTGSGTGCAFSNSFPFIKFDNLDIYKGNGTFTLSITFNKKVQLADILIKSATNCFPFVLNFTPNCNEPPAETHSETAYAYGGDSAKCFSEYGFKRWGWTNGEYAEGDYTLDLYAGAGQCDITKGTLVGNVTVNYHGGVATVKYNVNAPYTLGETHLYVGNNPLYPKAVAPGQSPFTGGGANYQVTGLSGSIYVIAHAEVGGFTK